MATDILGYNRIMCHAIITYYTTLLCNVYLRDPTLTQEECTAWLSPRRPAATLEGSTR